MRRTTIFLPTNMLLNLQVLALQTGESQSTIIRTALVEYMVKQGYKPYAKSKVRVRHRKG